VVRSHLASRHLLLVIDNCEHVLDAAATLVAQLLGAGRGVSVLATSRESLGVPGETVFRVPSLGLPRDDADAAASDSVRLFLDRAANVRPGFTVAGDDLAAVVRVCRRLDGIPLGIELAAARLRMLTPRELADRLDDSFRILTGGAKTSVPRQRTLQTAIDWSYDLLEPDEAALFRRVSAFAGGFDLAAAEVVGAGDGVEGWEVLDLLDQLVDKSLVSAVQGEAGTRFRLLEPIRQYGQERLAQGGEAESVRLAHARYYSDLAASAAPRLRSSEQFDANRELLSELDNLRAALATFDETGMADQFFRMCFDLAWFWGQSSLQVEGRELVLGGLRRFGAAASPSVRARAWFVASMLAVFLTDPNGVEYADRALDAARVAGEDSLIGWMELQRGVAQANVGLPDPDNQRWFDQARRRFEAGNGAPMWDPEWDQAIWRFMLAFGKSASAAERRRDLTEATERARQLGDGYLAANAMAATYYLADDADPQWKVAMLRESVEVLRRLDFRHGLGHSLFYLGLALADEGGGLAELGEASRMLAEVGDLPCSTWSAARLIRSLLDAGDLEMARRELVAVAGRLLSFDREVDAEIAGLACRLALSTGDIDGAAWFLGYAEAREHPSRSTDVDECRRRIESSFVAGEGELLFAAGAATGRTQMLERILALGAS
jgi:predicted ATPase